MSRAFWLDVNGKMTLRHLVHLFCFDNGIRFSPWLHFCYKGGASLNMSQCVQDAALEPQLDLRLFWARDCPLPALQSCCFRHLPRWSDTGAAVAMLILEYDDYEARSGSRSSAEAALGQTRIHAEPGYSPRPIFHGADRTLKGPDHWPRPTFHGVDHIVETDVRLLLSKNILKIGALADMVVGYCGHWISETALAADRLVRIEQCFLPVAADAHF